MSSGLDSLGAVELRNSLEAALGIDLPTTLVFDYPTVDAVADFVTAQMRGLFQDLLPLPLSRSGDCQDLADLSSDLSDLDLEPGKASYTGHLESGNMPSAMRRRAEGHPGGKWAVLLPPSPAPPPPVAVLAIATRSPRGTAMGFEVADAILQVRT